MIRPMNGEDGERVQQVELDAGELFRSFREPRVAACADNDPFAVDELRAFADAGRGWVVTEDDVVVGFVVAEVVDGCGHVEELAVARSHQGRGLGTALLDAVAGWASGLGLPALTLTTFREVPWNRPYYERRGFRVLAEAEWTDGLRAKVVEEERFGLPAELRVVMRREGNEPARRLYESAGFEVASSRMRKRLES